jgi:stage II sporulation protein D
MNGKSYMRGVLSLLLAAGLALGGVRITSRPAQAADAASPVRTVLRVGMWTLWRDRQVVLTPTNSAQRIALRGCERCAIQSFPEPLQVRAEGNGVAFTAADRVGHLDRILLSGGVKLMAHGETVALENPVTITAHAGQLVIAVTLPVESYVERVVASESDPADSPESLKALAIVVRTFALHEKHGHTDYDLCDSTHCQLLHWDENGARHAAAHAAALATSGETLWYRGQRALAYFSKDCGGHTASPEEIWPRAKAIPYLPSRPDSFCATGGRNEWASEATHAELTAALAAAGVAAPGWRELNVAKRGESGRAVALQIDGSQVSADTFRLAVGQALGWNRIPSTWFEVSQQGDRFRFHGRGWGNGVGLCQKGASAMAAQGRSENEILEQYFPGAQSADESTGRVWKHFAGNGFTLESLDGADDEHMPEIERARADASNRSGLNVSGIFTVRAFASTSAFREATLAPGWMAAFTEGEWIATQPLRTLAARRLLDATMRHEFLHGLVERQAVPDAPLWLREGLVEVWSEDAAPGHGSEPAMKLNAVNAALARSTSEEESEAAHRAAGWYAARLLSRYGRAQALQWLRSGIPAEAIAALGQR